MTNFARNQMFQSRNDERIQDEARLANEIQAQHPDMSRTEALIWAAKIARKTA